MKQLVNDSLIICVIICLLYCNGLFGQQPSGVIEISGQIIHKGNTTESPLDLELYIKDYGAVDIDHQGEFEFKAPQGLDLHIEIIPSEFRVLRPLDGFLKGEAQSYRIEIIILHGTQDSLLKQQISELDEEVRRLQNQNELGENQIARLDQIILDTVFYYQKIKNRYKQRVNRLNQSLNQSVEKNEALKDSLISYQNIVNDLNDSISILVNRLTIALEERYLRQKQHFDHFTNLLLDYQTRLKDVYDFLPGIEDCFRHSGALNQFNELGKRYGQARNALYENHSKHIEGIQRYWSNGSCYLEAESICNYIFEDIHDQIFLQGINQEIIPNLKEYATRGIRKVKDTRKAGGFDYGRT